MKKCFLFFTALIITLMIAVLTENREAEVPLETVAVGTSNLK